MPACPASPHGWVVGHITTAGSRVPCEVLPSSSPNFILSKHHNILLVLPKEAIAVSKRKQRIRASQSRQIRYFQFGAAALLTSLPTSAVSIFDFFFYISPMFIIKTHHHHLITTGIESNFAQEHSKIREHQFKLMQKTKCSCFAVLQRNQDQHMSRYNPYLLNCSAGNWVFGCFFFSWFPTPFFPPPSPPNKQQGCAEAFSLPCPPRSNGRIQTRWLSTPQTNSSASSRAPSVRLQVLQTAEASRGGWGMAATGYGPSWYNGKAAANAGTGPGRIPAPWPCCTCCGAWTVTISCVANISQEGAWSGHRAALREITVLLCL